MLSTVRGRAGAAIGEGAASVAVKAPGLGLEGSWRETETWHPGAGAESLKRAPEGTGESASQPQQRPEELGGASTTG